MITVQKNTFYPCVIFGVRTISVHMKILTGTKNYCKLMFLKSRIFYLNRKIGAEFAFDNASQYKQSEFDY